MFVADISSMNKGSVFTLRQAWSSRCKFGTNVVQSLYQEGHLYRKVEEVLQGTFSNLEY